MIDLPTVKPRKVIASGCKQNPQDMSEESLEDSEFEFMENVWHKH